MRTWWNIPCLWLVDSSPPPNTRPPTVRWSTCVYIVIVRMLFSIVIFNGKFKTRPPRSGGQTKVWLWWLWMVITNTIITKYLHHHHLVTITIMKNLRHNCQAIVIFAARSSSKSIQDSSYKDSSYNDHHHNKDLRHNRQAESLSDEKSVEKPNCDAWFHIHLNHHHHIKNHHKKRRNI